MKKIVLAMAVFAMVGIVSAETIVQFNFEDATKNPSTEATGVSSTAIGAWREIDDGAPFNDEALAAFNGHDAWRTRNDASLEEHYAAFTITVAAGKQLEITDFALQLYDRDADLFPTLTFAYSTDGGDNYTDMGTLDPLDIGSGDWFDQSLTLGTPVSGLEGDIIIRMTTGGANGGYDYFEHDLLTVNGTLSATQVAGTVVIVK